MVFSESGSFLKWHLDETQAIAIDNSRPARDGVTNQLRGRAQPFELYVVAVLGIVNAI